MESTTMRQRHLKLATALAAAVLMAGLSGTVLWRGGDIQGTLQTTRTGGVVCSMTRACMGEVCVRSTISPGRSTWIVSQTSRAG